MFKLSIAKTGLLLFVLLCSVNLYAQDSKNPDLYENDYVSISGGLLYYYFSENDDFRNPTGLFGNSDKIKRLAGIDLSAELLLNKTFSLNLPVGIGTGYKFQTMIGGFEYSTYSGTTIKRTVDISNHIVFVDLYLPIDSDKYWLAGLTAGVGASQYRFKIDYSNSTSDVSKTANGFILPVGVFLDWGADGIGGRLGYTYVFSKYPELMGSTPKGNGSMFYIELRYAI